MALQLHLDLLEQGVEAWNQWRKENSDVLIDLRMANLVGVNLRGANLRGVDFKGTHLNGANLSEADLRGAIFVTANLSWANLTRADLSWADFSEANLTGTTLEGTTLIDADLSLSNLFRAKLNNANLNGAILSKVTLLATELSGADFSQATMASTIFGDVDLSLVKGLDAVNHGGPSTIGIDTMIRSEGNIPVSFLRGAGVSDTIIDYRHSLVGKAIDYQTCFISYSSKDEPFAKRLYTDLQSRGVRCWFAPEDLKIGDRFRRRIDESIYLYDKLLLVLSQHSVASQWVELEVETALAKERKERRTVLFPIQLDMAVMRIEHGWPAVICNTRHIGNFENWGNSDSYKKAFDRLLRDLKAERLKPEV